MYKSMFEIAILVSSPYLPAWQLQILATLVDIAIIKTVFFYQLEPEYGATKPTLGYGKALKALDKFLYKTNLTALDISPFVDKLDMETKLINLAKSDNKNSDKEFDIVIDFSNRPFENNSYFNPRLGLWRFFYSSNPAIDMQHAGIDEYLRDEQQVFYGVVCHKPHQNEQYPIYMASSGVDDVSIARTIDPMLWRLAYGIQEILKMLSHYPKDEQSTVLIRASKRLSLQTKQMQSQFVRMRKAPLIDLKKCFLNKTMKKIQDKFFYRQQWGLLYQVNSNPIDAMRNLTRFEKIIPPKNVIWADPFLLTHESIDYVFIEEVIPSGNRRGKGHIAYMKIDGDGNYSNPVKVLERPYHLSYPFIFQYQNTYYMIPETSENGQIELYKCQQFPNKWSFERVLMGNISAYDTTLFIYNGYWWLLTSIRHHSACNPNECLYLFFADNPLSQHWQAHPLNPIVNDVSRARGGGRVFEWQGKLYRPSQNCAGSYGKGLNINEIVTLTPHDYEEVCVTSCVPNGRYQLAGVHTISYNKQLTVIDGIYTHKLFG